MDDLASLIRKYSFGNMEAAHHHRKVHHLLPNADADEDEPTPAAPTAFFLLLHLLKIPSSFSFTSANRMFVNSAIG
jgi:hypothetical protein